MRRPFAMVPHGVAFAAITPGAKELYTFLVARCGNRGECRWPQESLAKALRCSVRTIARRLKELTGPDPLIESRRKGSTANLYSIPEEFPRQFELPFGRTDQTPVADRIYRTEKDSLEKAAELPQVQAALKKSRRAIEQARNPRAYQAAIIRRVSATPCNGAVSASPEMAPSFHRPENLDGLEEFIAAHESVQASRMTIPPDSAPIGGFAKPPDNIRPVCSEPEVEHVQPMQRPGILRRPAQRALRRAVEVVSLPGFLRSPEQHARTG